MILLFLLFWRAGWKLEFRRPRVRSYWNNTYIDSGIYTVYGLNVL